MLPYSDTLLVGAAGTSGVLLVTVVVLLRRRKPAVPRASGNGRRMGTDRGFGRGPGQAASVTERAVLFASTDLDHAREALRAAKANRRGNKVGKARRQWTTERVWQARRAYDAQTMLPMPDGLTAKAEHITEQWLLRGLADRLRARELAGTFELPPIGPTPPDRGPVGRRVRWMLGGERIGLAHDVVVALQDQVADATRALAKAHAAAEAGDDEMATQLLRAAVSNHLALSR